MAKKTSEIGADRTEELLKIAEMMAWEGSASKELAKYLGLSTASIFNYLKGKGGVRDSNRMQKLYQEAGLPEENSAIWSPAGENSEAEKVTEKKKGRKSRKVRKVRKQKAAKKAAPVEAPTASISMHAVVRIPLPKEVVGWTLEQSLTDNDEVELHFTKSE